MRINECESHNLGSRAEIPEIYQEDGPRDDFLQECLMQLKADSDEEQEREHDHPRTAARVMVFGCIPASTVGDLIKVECGKVQSDPSCITILRTSQLHTHRHTHTMEHYQS